MDREFIRNFSIIAHIDHGKSTLADRLLEVTGALSQREMMEQVLDSMDLERERGITIKAHAVRLNYRADDGKLYQLNLIDTPGHVDFSYEVSRSLQACEGALLVVDASQGVEAQTLANTYLALHHNLEIIPVINKIDLPAAEPERIREQIETVVGIDARDAVLCSAKQGVGIHDILEAIVHLVPPPKGSPDAPLRALIFDSWFDSYRGVIILMRIIDGRMKLGQKIKLMANGQVFEVEGLGYQAPKATACSELQAGEVGFLYANIKTVGDAKIGDTITEVENPATEPLPGFEEIKPMVFAGLYPVESHEHGLLRDALEKLRLNDSAFNFEPENSAALGFGFRCGFLGLLHLEIVQERLEREFNIDLITTAPGVRYRITDTSGNLVEVDNPTKFPDPSYIETIEEPIIDASVITREDFLGGILALLEEKRGTQKKFEHIGAGRVMLTYELPLNEIVLDFYDRLKSASKGYASLDYHLSGYRESPMVKLDVLVAGEPVDALSIIVHKDFAFERGKALISRLRKLIPKQMFEVALQAAIGNKIVARETISAMRKNVIAKCYGGDISRKRKLLEKQKEGKKRMKRVGRVEIPQEAFLSVLKVSQSSDDD
uniref:Elongation factor 4 n=1 Tax=Solibacter usitatus (strain Ellin6076) TaxID=234267 RepID=LEPA_SOLUE|nr:RecName: Full=Elongation factor 4; Short=EF-4; AltName: Full=Ribosomal back-translocase LepA [Candidatus Solibacter usitatus Ellin6076]